jgi:glycosyltransferase involved in cell wall biosynthesis
MSAGIAAATAPFTATLDADLQNDPADLLPMLRKAQSGDADIVQGDRSRNRKDSVARRYASIIGRRARGLLLGDSVRDTGCSARVIRSDLAKQIPLQYKGVHRFVPVYVKALGGRVVEMPVNHRARHAGVTKYGVGVITRGWNGLLDCFAVWWMRNRLRKTDAVPYERVDEGASDRS